MLLCINHSTAANFVNHLISNGINADFDKEKKLVNLAGFKYWVGNAMKQRDAQTLVSMGEMQGCKVRRLDEDYTMHLQLNSGQSLVLKNELGEVRRFKRVNGVIVAAEKIGLKEVTFILDQNETELAK